MSYINPVEVERFIHYAENYLSYPQVSLRDIRERQDVDLTHSIYRRTMEFFKSSPLNRLDQQSFFAGSVDFMVHREQGQESRYYILETNGGSSRGFAVLPPDQWEIAIDGYLEALSASRDKRPVVLIGHPKKDLVLYEKVILAEAYSQQIRDSGRGDGLIADIERFVAGKAPGAQVIIGGYDKIIPALRLSEEQERIMIGDREISVVVGDGVVRRHPATSEHLMTGGLDTVVVNDTFHISDDKALTYQAVEQCRTTLRHFGIEPIRSWRGKNRFELQKICREALKTLGQVVIKPHGGSGGSGIDIITDMNAIGKKIEDSIVHYQQKTGAGRNPFPYTVSQLIDATPCIWRGGQRKFDIRVYVCRKGATVHPVGALVRIALEPFAGQYTKRTFVVNLSGYGGVDTARGLGLSDETLALLGLTEDDFVRMFAAAATITAHIANNHETLAGLL